MRATARGSSSCSIGRRLAWTACRIACVGQLDRALEHDRAGVDPFVDEVDRHPEDLHAVLDGLLDRAHAREGGQQRGMDVEDPVGEARHEPRVEDRHVAGEDHELDPAARPASRPWRRRARRAPRTPSAGRPATARPPPARARARAPRADRRPRRRPRPRGRGRCRAAPGGSCPRPRRGRRLLVIRPRPLRPQPQLGVGAAGGDQPPLVEQLVHARRAPRPRADGRTSRRRAGRRRRSCARPASARRAGSRPCACARPRARRR